MEYTKLGTLDIPKIVIGTWSWGNGDFGGKDIFGNNFGENELKEVFMSALRNGFNMYDTAALYSLGESEEILGNLSEYYNSKALTEGEIRKEHFSIDLPVHKHTRAGWLWLLRTYCRCPQGSPVPPSN